MDDLEHPRDLAPRLVFFDLDGTITRRDTLIGYVAGFALRNPRRLLGFVRVLPALLTFAWHRDRGQLKGELIHRLMGGASRDDIDAWTQLYVPRLLTRGVFPEALSAIARHRAAGDHLVLMSATVDLYVPQLAEALGFNEHICSRVDWQGDGRLAGRLASANVRDQEKARQLKIVAARFPGRRIVAYGNSTPDLDHLRLVDEAVLVNAGKRLRMAAHSLPAKFKIWL